METNKQSRLTQDVLLTILLLFGIGWLIYTYQVLFGPLIISGIITYLLYSVVTWLSERTRISRRRIVPLVYILFLSILISTTIYLAPIAASQTSLLSRQLTVLPSQIQSLQTPLENLLGFSLPLDSFIEEFEIDAI